MHPILKSVKLNIYLHIYFFNSKKRPLTLFCMHNTELGIFVIPSAHSFRYYSRTMFITQTWNFLFPNSLFYVYYRKFIELLKLNKKTKTLIQQWQRT